MDTQEKINKRREESKKAQEHNKKVANAKIKPKTRNTIIGILCAIVALVAVFALVFPNTALSRRVVTAATIGDTKVSAAEFSYYYNATYQSYYNMFVSYLGEDYLPFDTTKSLKDQAYNDEMSYADYFEQSALDALKQIIVLSDKAEEEGYTLSDEGKEDIASTISTVQAYAELYGYSTNDYLAAMYGQGVNLSLFEKILNREALASEYADYKQASFTYTDEELEAYYEEHATDYQTADVRVVSFTTEAGTENEDGTTTGGVTAEEAKALADAFVASVTDEASFEAAALAKERAEAAKAAAAEAAAEEAAEAAAEAEESSEEASEETSAEATETSEETSGETSEESAEEVDETYGIDESSSLYSDVSYSNLSYYIDSNVADWAFTGGHAAGDVEVVEGADGDTYFAVMLVSEPARSDAKYVNVRHILVMPEDDTEEAWAAAKDKAEDILVEYMKDTSEENFAALAEEYSDDTGSNTNGGLYEDVYPGQMVTEFNDWCFDPARYEGETGVVKTDYGYHIMYFVGYGDVIWSSEVAETLQEEDYNAWYEEASAGYETKVHKYGMSLRSEPILG